MMTILCIYNDALKGGNRQGFEALMPNIQADKYLVHPSVAIMC